MAMGARYYGAVEACVRPLLFGGKDHLFEPLQRLFRGDQVKIRRVLGILEKVLREDMEKLAQVRDNRDWIAVARLAHKIKSGCMQVGQHAAGAAMLGLEEAMQDRAFGDGSMDSEFDVANDEIQRLLMDIEGYLKEKDGH